MLFELLCTAIDLIYWFFQITLLGESLPHKTHFFFIASLHKYPIKTNSLLYDKTHKDKYIPFSILLKANTIVKDC